MIREEFLRLAAAGYNRIPLACETLADFDTPLSIYLKLADQPNSYLLESVQGGEKWGRYSIIGLASRTVLRAHGAKVSVSVDDQVVEAVGGGEVTRLHLLGGSQGGGARRDAEGVGSERLGGGHRQVRRVDAAGEGDHDRAQLAEVLDEPLRGRRHRVMEPSTSSTEPTMPV